MNGIPYNKLLDLFIGTLKDSIQHEAPLFEPTSLVKDFVLERKFESKNIVISTKRTTFNTYREINILLLVRISIPYDIQVEIYNYVAAIEWRMNIQTKKNKLHRKRTSIAQEFIVYSS